MSNEIGEHFVYDTIFIMPVLNEAGILESSVHLFLQAIRSIVTRDTRWALIIADNGSSDGTGDVAQKLEAADPHIRLCSLSVRGRGRALREVMRTYLARTYCFSDVDIPIEIEDIAKLFEPIKRDAADVVIVKRTGRRPFMRRLLSFGMRTLNATFFDIPFSDVQAGIKVFNSGAAHILLGECKEVGYFLDTEFVAACNRKSLRVTEVEAVWIEQRYQQRSSKIHLFSDSCRALQALMRIFWRAYKKTVPFMASFLGSCTVILGLFIFGKIFISQADFSIGEDAGNFSAYMLVARQVFFLACVTIVLGFSLHKMRSFPMNLFRVLVTCFFVAIVGVALLTHPTRSQDVYWNLLLVKGFVRQGLNPYQTTPLQLHLDPWAGPVHNWRAWSMVYGPAWPLLLSIVPMFTNTLGSAVLMTKIIGLIVLLFSGYLLWRIMSFYSFSREKKYLSIAFYALNPFIIQTVLVDFHNDVVIMLLVLWSYLLFLQKRYVLSVVALLFGGFIKYVPLLLIPYVLLMQGREKKTTEKFMSWIGVGGMASVMLFLLYLPFGGLTFENIKGVLFQSQLYLPGTSTIITVLLKNFLHLSSFQITLCSFLLALGAVFIMFKKNIRGSWAFIIPFVVVLMFSSWFEPWYILWFFPLLVLVLPLQVIGIISAILLSMYEIVPFFFVSAFVLLGLVFFLFFRRYMQMSMPAPESDQTAIPH